jgi:hypothetical protein
MQFYSQQSEDALDLNADEFTHDPPMTSTFLAYLGGMVSSAELAVDTPAI